MGQLQASVTTDGSGWFKSVSPAFLELIGRPVESLAGVNLIDLVHPLDAATARSLFALIAAGDVASATAPAPVRMLAANDAWRDTNFSVVAAGDQRLTVNLVAEIETVAVSPVPAAVQPSEATASPFESPARQLEVFSLDGAQSFPPASNPVDGDSTFAGDDVPQQRSRVRDSLAAGAAMLEISADGHTTFVSGPWNALSHADNRGAAAFEGVLERSGAADAVLDAVGEVMADGTARQIQLNSIEAAPWVQVLPIPSPERAGVVHALVAVVEARGEGELLGTMRAASVGASSGVVAPAAGSAPSPQAVAAPAEAIAKPVTADDVDEAIDASESTDAIEAADTTDVGKVDTPSDEQEGAGRGFFGWLAIGIAALLAIVLISRLWPGGDSASSAGQVDVEITATEATETQPGQTWRSTGVAALGEAHGIAWTQGWGYIAGINGTIVELDSAAQAVSAVTIGGDDTTFVSDIVADDAGRIWILDAGQGRLFIRDEDASVREVPTDANPLRNARGIGLSSDGMVWIASTASAQLTKVAEDGATATIIALPSRQPSDVLEVGDGTLWIVDSQEIELVHLDATGAVLNTVPLDSFTSLNSPHLTIVDDALWVTDPEMSAVLEVDLASGELIGEPVIMTRPGDLRVDKPIGIAADDGGRLWIADSTGGATIVVDN